jgi:hypothetical protein
MWDKKESLGILWYNKILKEYLLKLKYSSNILDILIS